MTKLASRQMSPGDLLKLEIQQTPEDQKCHKSCDHHVYDGRNLRCLRRAGHELSAEDDSVMNESHVDYIMHPDYTTSLISFDEKCCEGELDVG